MGLKGLVRIARQGGIAPIIDDWGSRDVQSQEIWREMQ